jgi:L-malate glycosyltransferase
VNLSTAYENEVDDKSRHLHSTLSKEEGIVRVLLINQEKIAHYRVGVYNYLNRCLSDENYALTVVSEGVQSGSTDAVEFDHAVMSLSTLSLGKLILGQDLDVVIFWVRLRHLYLFPILFLCKLLGKKVIYWGHGTDLGRGKLLWLKKFANDLEYRMFDALILYAGHLKKGVRTVHHRKTFIANNTLDFSRCRKTLDKASCLAKYKITTTRNVICCGRMQRRKRLEDLFAAFELLKRRDVGLILVGPDNDGILRDVQADNVYKLGPIYGDERLDLLAASDVFCLPGAIGLSIVDAFYCGLPIVTEAGDESPEIMYLKEGVNGFVVPRGNVPELAAKLELLLNDDSLRQRFSTAARNEIMTNGHMDRMCQGFSEALRFVCARQSA